MAAKFFLTADNTAPAEDCFVITPHDTDPLAQIVRGIWVGTGGDLEIITPAGTTVVFLNVPSGTLMPVRATHVKDDNTDADDIVGLV